MNNTNPVVHFEMPAENRSRMAEFYTKAFGWKTQEMGPEMGNYVVATTTDSDEKTGRPKAPGAINGGFYNKSDSSNKHPSIVIGVDDIMVAIDQVKEAGGTVMGEPVDIPGVGKYVSFKDTEGNTASMLQPMGQM